jgi:hypothetical protein
MRTKEIRIQASTEYIPMPDPVRPDYQTEDDPEETEDIEQEEEEEEEEEDSTQ